MDYEEAVRMSGYAGLDDYFKKLAIPVVAASAALFVITLVLVQLYGPLLDLGDYSSALLLIPLLVMLIGVIIVVGYPYYGVEKIKVNIHENIHYFITYAGALSSLHLQRKKLFRLSAQRIEYGEIAKVMEKVSYLSDRWNLSLVTSCRKLSTLVPSKVLGNFLDRMSAAFDFGERLDTFLLQEQEAVMEDFSGEYRQSLQTLNLIQDAMVSLTIAIAFMMAVAFMLPLIMGFDIYTLVLLSGASLIVLDILTLLFIDSFVTHDDICHRLPIKAKEFLQMRALAAPVFAITAVLFIIAVVFKPFNLWTPLLVSIAITPLAFIGYNAKQFESQVIQKDLAFPAFMRSLGGSMSARGGSLYGTLGPLRVHEFGILDEPVERLYKRLLVRCDKFQAWMYFAGETGSSLIERFGNIFIQVVTLGGDPEKASEIISQNFIKLLSLRELKLQLASSVRGVSYGILLGVAGSAFSSLRMVGILDNTFKKSFSAIAATPSVSSLTQGLLPTIGNINIPVVEDMLFFIFLGHTFLMAYSLKMIDGGTKWACLLDFVLMTWVLAACAIMVPIMFNWVFQTGASASGSVAQGVGVPGG